MSLYTKYIYGVRRTIYNLTKGRPSSYPYISGDTFRTVADHIWDESSLTLPYRKIKPADSIFVPTDRIYSFFNNIHPHIKEPYILITHNSDGLVSEHELGFIDEKIIHWFAQNANVVNEYITPIPIGLENKRHYRHGIPSLFNSAHRDIDTHSRKPLVVYGFNVHTNKEVRGPILHLLKQTSVADPLPSSLDERAYISTVSQYAMIASPPGNGLDCHRTWEALYLGIIPIVQDTVANSFFKSKQIPLYLVNEWSKLINLTEQEIINLYTAYKPFFNSEALWAPYWFQCIEDKKKQFFSS